MTLGMNTLVTGASGLVGKALVEELINAGGEIRILTRDESALPAHWSEHVSIHVGDLTEPHTIMELADGIDIVYHLAGEINDPALFDAVNRLGTQSLLEVCQRAHVRRFLYLSSVGVFGAGGYSPRRSGNFTVDESTTPQPRNGYERSKYDGERAALASHCKDGMQVSVVRPSIVYGEQTGHRRQDHFGSLLRAIRRRRFVLLGTEFSNSYVYVRDLVAACQFVIKHPEAGGETYIVNEPIPLTDFIYEMASLLGTSPPPILPHPLGPLAARLLDITGRFQSLYNGAVFSMQRLTDLGFELPFGYRLGLKRTIQSYLRAGLLS